MKKFRQIITMNKMHFGILLGLSFVCSISNAQVTTFDYTGAAENYTVPAGVTLIQIEVSGGQGGFGDGGDGGLGATMIGTFEVTPGDILQVVVGGAGQKFGNSGGGGGGTGVLFEGNPLVLAGGGGGGAFNAAGYGGLITIEGGSSSGPGGVAGYGGSKGYSSADCGWAGGGGGFYGDGYGGNLDWDGGPLPGVLAGRGGGRAWSVAEGAGGIDGGCLFVSNAGAFGCGGGGAGEYGGAGGGGYSGGGGGQYIEMDATKHGGGGGGSINLGVDQINTPANHSGAGQAIITIICTEMVISYDVTLESFGGDAAIDITISGGNGGFLFDWDNDGTGDFDDTEDLSDLTEGTYIILVDDEPRCNDVTETIIVGSQVGIIETTTKDFLLYPNPASANFTIVQEGEYTYTIYNSLGQILDSNSAFGQITVSCLALPKGIYTIAIENTNESIIETLIIQ